jgi:hypothetical protein
MPGWFLSGSVCHVHNACATYLDCLFTLHKPAGRSVARQRYTTYFRKFKFDWREESDGAERINKGRKEERVIRQRKKIKKNAKLIHERITW